MLIIHQEREKAERERKQREKQRQERELAMQLVQDKQRRDRPRQDRFRRRGSAPSSKQNIGSSVAPYMPEVCGHTYSQIDPSSSDYDWEASLAHQTSIASADIDLSKLMELSREESGLLSGRAELHSSSSRELSLLDLPRPMLGGGVSGAQLGDLFLPSELNHLIILFVYYILAKFSEAGLFLSGLCSHLVYITLLSALACKGGATKCIHQLRQRVSSSSEHSEIVGILIVTCTMIVAHIYIVFLWIFLTHLARRASNHGFPFQCFY